MTSRWQKKGNVNLSAQQQQPPASNDDTEMRNVDDDDSKKSGLAYYAFITIDSYNPDALD